MKSRNDYIEFINRERPCGMDVVEVQELLMFVCQYLCILAKNLASYAHFLFAIFILEFDGRCYMKKTIN